MEGKEYLQLCTGFHKITTSNFKHVISIFGDRVLDIWAAAEASKQAIIYVISPCCHLKVGILTIVLKNQTPPQPLAALPHLYVQLVRRSKLLEEELQAGCNHPLIFYLALLLCGNLLVP